MHAWLIKLSLLLLVVPLTIVASEIQVVDDQGNTVTLVKPARRIITLAPHLTEALYAAGAGQYIVATVSYSDFPEQAKRIPRIGSYVRPDLEAIVNLKPDLIVAWQSSNSQPHLDKLRALGIPVFVDEPRNIIDVATTIERLGKLAATTEQAKKHNVDFLQTYVRLQKKYSDRKIIKLFYQFWNEPLMTISGEHLIGEVMELCGAENVFAEALGLAPKVSVEAVLQAKPEVIVAASMGDAYRKWLAYWRQWTILPAVKNNHLYSVNPDYLHRAGPRILLGAEQLCKAVDRAR